MRRFVVALPLVAMAACSRFTSDDAVADGGTGTGRDGGEAAADDAARADGPPLDAGGGNDGSSTLCTSFAAEPFDDGWRRAVSGGTFAVTNFMGRGCLEARVIAGGQSAVAARSLSMPADGTFKVTVPLHVTGIPNATVGWIVDVVSITCANPASSLSLELAPDGNLFVEASPAAAGFGAAAFGVPPQGWSDLELAVADTVVAVTFAGQTKTVALDSSAPYRNAIGCALAVGATAKANVTQTTVRAEKACLQHL